MTVPSLYWWACLASRVPREAVDSANKVSGIGKFRPLPILTKFLAARMPAESEAHIIGQILPSTVGQRGIGLVPRYSDAAPLPSAATAPLSEMSSGY